MGKRPDVAKRNRANRGKKHAPDCHHCDVARRKHSPARAAKCAAAHVGLLYKAEVAYDGAHKRARNALPHVCQKCGTNEGILEACLKKDAPPESLREQLRGEKSLTYSIAYPPDVAYVRLCRFCHRAYDKVSVP